MAKLDHIGFPTSDWTASRDCYADVLDLTVEVELTDIGVVSMTDDNGLSVFLTRGSPPPDAAAIGFWCKVEDVDEFHATALARGVAFVHRPQRTDWATARSCAIPTATAPISATRRRWRPLASGRPS